MLLASGVVALPLALVLADTLARTWPDAGSDAGRVLVAAVVWVLMLVWALGGIRIGR